MAFQLSKNQFLNCNSMTQTTRRIYTSSITFLGKPHRRTSLTATGAQKFVKDLNEEERSLLMTALSKRNNFLAMQAGLPLVQQPSIQELYKLGLHQSLPFVGFGFLDNLIMIVAGEYIDASIGATLSISTMAAAALGNTLSDVFGVGSAWYVEHWAAKLGISPPALSIEQLDLKSSRIASNAGRAVGVAVGCVIGMFPLLFYKAEVEESKQEEEILVENQNKN